VEQARQPALYTAYGVADTPAGRFELYTLHMVLLVDRIQPHGAQGAETAQALFDTYIKGLDHGLRELGVGDTSVGKKMRKLGEAIYGRAKSYQSAFAALPDQTELRALLQRTVYAEGDSAPAEQLTEYVLAQRSALEGQPIEALLEGSVSWRPA
jgi:cytochrome b pre-mRNA-processing protein 3